MTLFVASIFNAHRDNLLLSVLGMGMSALSQYRIPRDVVPPRKDQSVKITRNILIGILFVVVLFFGLIFILSRGQSR